MEDPIMNTNLPQIEAVLEESASEISDQLFHRIPITVTTSNLYYEVSQSLTLAEFLFCQKRQKKEPTVILDSIDFVAEPGKFVVIMGPSGSGKTSLLNILSGRIKNKKNVKLAGSVLFNNRDPKDFGSVSSYVMQNDILPDFLTVQEVLDYRINLKLKHETKEMKEQARDNIIEELGLQNCRHTRVGNQYYKGLSGGEKKRLSIATELVGNPSLLFLDEPTTGLDASIAYDTVKLLWALAKKGGRTVICTMHQPRSQMYSLIDQLVLLSRGGIVYHGPAADAIHYFSTIGYECPPAFNPADFFLDVLNPPTNKNIADCESVEDRYQMKASEIANLSKFFEDSEYGKNFQGRLKEIEYADPKKFAAPEPSKNSLSHRSIIDWFIEIGIISKKNFMNTLRNPLLSYSQIFINLVMGLIFGGFYFDVGNSQPSVKAFSNILGFLFFITANYSFSAFACMDAFIIERPLFNRDTKNGVYLESSYFVAKQISDLPFVHVPPIFFTIPLYFMTSIGNTASDFLLFFLISELCVFASTGLMYALGGASKNVAIAQAYAPILLIVFMLLAGFYLSSDAIPAWIDWIGYFSFIKYGFLAFVKSIFPQGGNYGSKPVSEYIAMFGLLDLNMTTTIFILIGMGFGYRMLAWLVVKYMNREEGSMS